MCRSGIATNLARVYLQSQETIKVKYLAKQKTISFTQDAWTAPNCTAFLGVTAHFIDEKFQMRDLTLAVPHVQGKF
jgi:hypothetical protein